MARGVTVIAGRCEVVTVSALNCHDQDSKLDPLLTMANRDMVRSVGFGCKRDTRSAFDRAAPNRRLARRNAGGSLMCDSFGLDGRVAGRECVGCGGRRCKCRNYISRTYSCP